MWFRRNWRRVERGKCLDMPASPTALAVWLHCDAAPQASARICQQHGRGWFRSEHQGKETAKPASPVAVRVRLRYAVALQSSADSC